MNDRVSKLEPREVLRTTQGVILNGELPLDAYEEMARQAERSNEGYRDLLANAYRDADLVMAEEMPDFDQMQIRQKISSLERLLNEMIKNPKNEDRYVYGELNRRLQKLQKDLAFLLE